jgi:hypothetical protein
LTRILLHYSLAFLVQDANLDSPAGAVFLVDPVKEFNMHIDAPAEKEEDIFS